MPLINNNKSGIQSEFFVKKTGREGRGKTEFYALSFIHDNNLMPVPWPVSYNPEGDKLLMPIIKGDLLIKFLRDIRLRNPCNKFLNEEYIGSLTEAIIDEVIASIRGIHSEYLELQPLPYIKFTKYQYKRKFIKTIRQINNFFPAKVSVVNLAIDDASRIGTLLEKTAVVPFLDASIYNIIVSTDKIGGAEGLLGIVNNKAARDAARLISENLIYIDFETFDNLVNPLDDISIVLESTVVRKTSARHAYKAIMSGYDYLLVAAYRNLRSFLRHLKYLLDFPDIYVKRYLHYGSLGEESPIWYLDRAIDSSNSLINLYNLEMIYMRRWLKLLKSRSSERVAKNLKQLEISYSPLVR